MNVKTEADVWVWGLFRHAVMLLPESPLQLQSKGGSSQAQEGHQANTYRETVYDSMSDRFFDADVLKVFQRLLRDI